MFLEEWKALRMLLVTWVLEDWAAGSLSLWPNAGNVASEADSIGTKLIMLVLTLKLKQKRRWGSIVVILLNKTFHPSITNLIIFWIAVLNIDKWVSDKDFQWLKSNINHIQCNASLIIFFDTHNSDVTWLSSPNYQNMRLKNNQYWDAPWPVTTTALLYTSLIIFS